MEMAVSRDVWLKHTDKKGHTHVTHHMVWDIGLFMEARQKEAAKEGGKVEQVLKPEKTK